MITLVTAWKQAIFLFLNFPAIRPLLCLFISLVPGAHASKDLIRYFASEDPAFDGDLDGPSKRRYLALHASSGSWDSSVPGSVSLLEGMSSFQIPAVLPVQASA